MRFHWTVGALPGLALLLAKVPAPAAARTWHVPDEVGTIAAALDSAAAGDVIELACGTYHEHDLNLKSGVVLRSEEGVAGCATIDAQGRVQPSGTYFCRLRAGDRIMTQAMALIR